MFISAQAAQKLMLKLFTPRVMGASATLRSVDSWGQFNCERVKQ